MSLTRTGNKSFSFSIMLYAIFSLSYWERTLPHRGCRRHLFLPAGIHLQCISGWLRHQVQRFCGHHNLSKADVYLPWKYITHIVVAQWWWFHNNHFFIYRRYFPSPKSNHHLLTSTIYLAIHPMDNIPKYLLFVPPLIILTLMVMKSFTLILINTFRRRLWRLLHRWL